MILFDSYACSYKNRGCRMCNSPLVFTKKNTPHPPLRVDRALKTRFVFYWSKIPVMQVLCHRRNKVSASRPYAPDTRGVCFQGPSRVLWYFKHPAGGGSMPPHSTGMKSEVSLTKAKLLVRSVHFCSEPGSSFATVPHRCVTQ